MSDKLWLAGETGPVLWDPKTDTFYYPDPKDNIVMSGTEHLKPPYTPQRIDDVTAAFPANVSHLMPKWNLGIGDEWGRKPEAQTWVRFQRDWFFGGLPEGCGIVAKEGIDPEVAMKHLAAIQRSFEPKHEEKEYAVSFLASQWFERVVDADGNLIYGREA